uniref:Uncharacterized protein n=1 Tax=Panagrolaimus sp. PS1159 TaxID=55785 RepID=A0AC35FIM5_9BILA
MISNWFVNNTGLIFAVSITVYTILVLILFFVLKKLKPEKFQPAEKLEPLGVNPRQITFLDCSCFYQICPCGYISLRQLLRKCCPIEITLHEVATCECIRPAIQGNIPYRVNFVCCTV